jgi:hypothetical protein
LGATLADRVQRKAAMAMTQIQLQNAFADVACFCATLQSAASGGFGANKRNVVATAEGVSVDR